MEEKSFCGYKTNCEINFTLFSNALLGDVFL